MREFVLRCVNAPARVLARLLRRPGYTATIVLSLALGIGAVTSVFALVHAVVLSALPFPDADALMLVRQKNATAVWNTSVADFRGIQEHATAFESVAAMRQASALVGSGENNQWRSARWITADFFAVVGVQPSNGRAPTADEDRPGTSNVVVIGQAFAAQQFAGRTDPIGQSIMIDGSPHTVIGVMPAGFEQSPLVGAEIWPVMQLASPQRAALSCCRRSFACGTESRRRRQPMTWRPSADASSPSGNKDSTTNRRASAPSRSKMSLLREPPISSGPRWQRSSFCC